MKNRMKSIISLATLAVALNTAPAQPAHTPAAPSEPPRPQRPARPALAESSSSAQFDRAAEQFDAAQMAFAKANTAVEKSWAIAGGGPSSASHSLVIPRDGSDAKTLEDCEEDLNVMARILDKAASRRPDKGRNAMGISVYGGVFGESGAPRNLYVEGYGALFFLNVNYPLVAPPAKEAEAEPKEDTSSEWEETRRELYQPSSGGPILGEIPIMSRLYDTGAGPGQEYDTEKVEDLKQGLIAALKNAAHIRKLKSDETVTIVVTGRSGGPEPKVFMKKSGSGGGGSSSSSSGGGGGGGGSAGYTDRLAGVIQKVPRVGGGRGSKLILRAKRSDLEALQKDKLTLEEFRKKVSLQVY